MPARKNKAAKSSPILRHECRLVPIDDLKPHPRNARKHADGAIDKSIAANGFYKPVVASSRSGYILAGHGSWERAKAAGFTEIPVYFIEAQDEAAELRIMVADNRTNDLSPGYDDQMLAEMLQSVQSEAGGLEGAGYDQEAFDEVLKRAGNAVLAQAPGGTTEPSWDGMPAFNQEDLMPWQTIHVHFAKLEDRQSFAELVGQQITDATKYLWHPAATLIKTKDVISYKSTSPQMPRYPVYVISKGRAESRLTSKALEKIGVPYSIVIEPQEYEQYAAAIDQAKILVLPFSNLGQGSIPARNWVWEHSKDRGDKRHWILDDNIRSFMRLRDNQKVRVASGEVFCAAEDFADRYLNVALCGFNYQWLAKARQKIPPFLMNTRIYSCILIDNALPFKWRGRYNEDTDLSLRALKAGFCTVQFNAFLADKQTTMSMTGGNTDELYKGDGRRKMAESLRKQHPDVVEIAKEPLAASG